MLTIQPSSKHSMLATPAGGLSFTASVRGHTVVSDQPQRVGGMDTAPSPLEYLGVALAMCVALYARKYLDAHALSSEELAVDVKPIWRDAPGRIGRFEVTVHIPESLPEDHHGPLLQAARDCPVHHTLAHGAELGFELRPG